MYLVIGVTPALFAGGQQRRADHELYQRAAAMRRNGLALTANNFLIIAGVLEFLRGRPERAGRLLSAGRNVGGADKEMMVFRMPVSLAVSGWPPHS